MKHSWHMYFGSIEEKRETCGFKCEHCDATVTETRPRFLSGEWGEWCRSRSFVDLSEDCPHNNKKVKEDIVKAHIQDMCRGLRGQNLDRDIIDDKLKDTKEVLAKRGIHVNFSVDHLEAGLTGFAGIITFDVTDPPEEKTDDKQDP